MSSDGFGSTHTLFEVDSKSQHRCDNCNLVHAGEMLWPIENLPQRIEPGGIVPSGQCSKCRALCYPIVEHQRRRRETECETVTEYCRSNATIQVCYACGLTTCPQCSRLLLDYGYSHRYTRVCANCLGDQPERFGLEADDKEHVHALFQFIPEEATDLKKFRPELLKAWRKHW